MDVPMGADGINELRNPTSTPNQITALRKLRNEVIGHYGKKESLVHHGIVDVLAQTLANVAKGRGKRNEDTNGAGVALGKHTTWTDQDELYLQALLLVGSLAHGGPAFVAPLVAGSIPQALLACISPRDNPPRVVHAALKALATLLDAEQQLRAVGEHQETRALDALDARSNVRDFVDILSQSTSAAVVQNQVSSVCKLIVWLSTLERLPDACVRAGILDLLAARLAAYYERQGFWSPRAGISHRINLPPPPSQQLLSLVFQAIISLVKNSLYRVARLLHSPVVMSILPFTSSDLSLESSMNFGSQQSVKTPHPVDACLPRVYSHNRHDHSNSKAFPPLGSLQTHSKPQTLMDSFTSGYNTPERRASHDNQESSMISWLIYTLRNEQGLSRIEAANLLTTIARTGFLSESKHRVLAQLVVPLLVSALDDAQPVSTAESVQNEDRLIRERAPRILADLIRGTPRLQEAAVEAGLLKRVSQLLKQTFGPVDAKVPLWSVEPVREVRLGLPSSRRLGNRGIRPDILHILKCRETLLILIASIAEKDDRYRKQLTEQGVVQCIIDSLTPLNEAAILELSDSARREKLDASYGNTTLVLLAACNAAKSISRAVSLLRTSLIDGGIAQPIFDLVKHSNVAVLIAATDVVCNIITEFSPMRQDLVQAGAIKVLCDHAHSADSRIREVSLWALVHLVHQSPNEVKEQCFDELGPGWLMQIISGSSTSGNVSRPAMGAANAAGQTVDILNAVDEPMDTSDGTTTRNTNQLDTSMGEEDDDAAAIFAQNPGLAAIAHQNRARLQHIKTKEDAYLAQQSARDERSIQVRGLNFVRNLIFGPSASEMIEMVFDQLGANRLFDIIASKLRSPIDSSGSAAAMFHADDILESAIFILVHLAAGAPRYRQQLMSQTNLLRLLIPIMTQHKSPNVRVSCTWCIANLTWVDNADDHASARKRAYDLRAMGFDDALEVLRTTEDSSDVKERANVAHDQIKKLLDDTSSYRSGSGRL